MFNISFQFDEQTKKVSNVKVEEIKTKEALKEGAFATLLDNKLVLSTDAKNLLGVNVGDRIAVKYFTENNETTFPVIGKASVFKDVEGNKLTKNLSISFRGDQRKILVEYGTTFKIEPFKDDEGMFKMASQDESDAEASEEQAVADAQTTLDKFEKNVDFVLSKDEASDNDDLPF